MSSRASGQVRIAALAMLALGVAGGARTHAAGQPVEKVDRLTYYTLSTMLADSDWGSESEPHGLLRQEPGGFKGEWGYAALVVVEVGGAVHRVLIDAGKHPHTVIENVRRAGLEKELCATQDVVLTHTHADHTGGLAPLRSWLKANPACTKRQRESALTRVYAPSGFFRDNPTVSPLYWDMPFPLPPPAHRESVEVDPTNRQTGYWFQREGAWVQFVKRTAEEAGIRFRQLDGPRQIVPGVIATDAIRVQMAGRSDYRASEGQSEVVEDQSVVIATRDGHIVISGCGHAGFVNTLNYVTNVLEPGGDSRVVGVLGGWHLLRLNADNLAGVFAEDRDADGGVSPDEVRRLSPGQSVIGTLRRLNVRFLLGSHCTGLDSLYSLRGAVDLLTADSAMIDSVGTQFIYERGRPKGERFRILPAFLNQPPAPTLRDMND